MKAVMASREKERRGQRVRHDSFSLGSKNVLLFPMVGVVAFSLLVG